MRFDTTPSGLQRIISRGESEIVEFKTKLPPGDSIAENLVALANSLGGILIIGGSDDSTIVGLSDLEKVRTITRLQQVAASLFSCQ